jgi:hypothetical protein
MDTKIPYILTEEGNPYIKQDNQKKRYAKSVWPISEVLGEDAITSNPFINYDIGEALATIAFTIHESQQNEKNAIIRANKNRDEIRMEFEAEIEALEDKLDHSLAIFSDLEQERYRAFINKHHQLHNDDENKKSDGITIHMIGTGVGICYTLECPICHETEDITDVASW